MSVTILADDTVKITNDNSPIRVVTAGQIPPGPAGGSGLISLDADFLSSTNIVLPNPHLSISGHFIVDGTIVTDGKVELLVNEGNPVQNGLYRYIEATNTLVRINEMLDGSPISTNFSVVIGDGESHLGETWIVTSPTSGIVGIDEISWADSDIGVGVVQNGTFTAGPRQPNYPNRPATQRRLVPADMPMYRQSNAFTGFPQSPYVNLNRFGYLSKYRLPSSMWHHRAAMSFALAEHHVLIVDIPLWLDAQVIAPLSGKHLVFPGVGIGGVNKILTGADISIFDLSGTHDVRFDGDLIIEHCSRAGAGTKAIKSSSGFSRFRADRIFSKGYSFLVNVTGTIDGFDVGALAVDDLSTDTPLTIDNSAAASSGKTRVGRIEGRPAVQTIATGGAITFAPYANSPIVRLGGAMSGDQTVTLSLQNPAEGYVAEFFHIATGGHAYSIGGLKSITNGQKARVMITAGAWTLIE